jgi:hypothetical protein
MGWDEWREWGGLVMLKTTLYLDWSVFSSRLPSPDSPPVSLQGFVKDSDKMLEIE